MLFYGRDELVVIDWFVSKAPRLFYFQIEFIRLISILHASVLLQVFFPLWPFRFIEEK